MFKVSFKQNPRFPTKKVQRFSDGKVTIVSLKGEMKLPKFLQPFIPPEIWKWIDTCRNVEATFTLTYMIITVHGKAKRADNDPDNPIFGERIAECRAKINLYRFMCLFLDKLYTYYGRILSNDTLSHSNANDETIGGTMIRYANLLTFEKAHLLHLLHHESDTESSPQP